MRRGAGSAGSLAIVMLSLIPSGLYGAIPVDGDAQDLRTFRPAAKPLLEIGREGDSAFQFTSITGVRLLEDGRVVVSDAGAREIRIFTPDGAHLGTLGGPGDGPGEFRSLDGLWTFGDGMIGAWDAENQRITTFDAHAPSVSVRTARIEAPVNSGMGSAPQVFLGTFLNGDVILASLAFGDPPVGPAPVPDRWFLGRFGSDGRFNEMLGELRGMRRLRGFPLPFSPLPHVALAGDTVFATDGYEGRVSVLFPKAVPGPRSFVLSPRIETPSVREAWESLEEALEEEGGALFLERIKDMPRSEAFPQVAGILPNEKTAAELNGTLWVRRYNPLFDSVWLGDVLRPKVGGEWVLVSVDGTVSGVLRVPNDFVPMHITGYRMAGVVIDPLGVERVAVHSLESGSGGL